MPEGECEGVKILWWPASHFIDTYSYSVVIYIESETSPAYRCLHVSH